jgi:hypothetical protein
VKLYLDKENVVESWGRYSIDDKDRIKFESDKGEKFTMYLVFGRQQLFWGPTILNPPPKK